MEEKNILAMSERDLGRLVKQLHQLGEQFSVAAEIAEKANQAVLALEKLKCDWAEIGKA